MKTPLYLLIIVGLTGCFNHQPAIKTGLEGNSIPSFDLLLADSTTHFNTKEIRAGKPVVLFYFQPWCPYCKAQIESMLNGIQSVNNIHFYLLTTSSFSLFKKFYNKYKLYEYPNITAGVDQSWFFASYFQARGVPYQAVYGRDRKLKGVLIGPKTISAVKSIAFE